MNKEGEIMSRVMSRINNMTIPPYIKRELGLSDNWQDSISRKKQKMVVRNALKFKETLKRLSKS